MKRPSFDLALTDNQRFDIVLAGIQFALSHDRAKRHHVAIWTDFLPDRRLVDSKTLINLFRWGRVAELKSLIDSGAKLRIPKMPNPNPIEISVGSFVGQADAFALCLRSLGPTSPVDLGVDACSMCLRLLEIYLEHYRDWWKEPECARQLRKAYNFIRERNAAYASDRRYQLLIRYDPLDSVPLDELVRRLMSCIEASIVTPDTDELWEEYTSYMENGRVRLNMLDVTFVLSVLKPTLDHRMSRALIESIMYELISEEGEKFLRQLSQETLRIWELPQEGFDSYMQTGYNSWVYSQAHKAVYNALYPERGQSSDSLTM